MKPLRLGILSTENDQRCQVRTCWRQYHDQKLGHLDVSKTAGYVRKKELVPAALRAGGVRVRVVGGVGTDQVRVLRSSLREDEGW